MQRQGSARAARSQRALGAGGAGDGGTGAAPLPVVDERQLAQWNERRRKCCGVLSKRSGSKTGGGIFGRSWGKRYFVIEHSLRSDRENYTLDYYNKAEDLGKGMAPRQRIPLAYALLYDEDRTHKKGVVYTFTLKLRDREGLLELAADTLDDMQNWTATLRYVIDTATQRAEAQKAARSGRGGDDQVGAGGAGAGSDDAGRDTLRSIHYSDELEQAQYDIGQAFIPAAVKQTPSLRLDIDISSIPPSSPERQQFEENLCVDLADALRIPPETVIITNIRKAAGMDWLTVVEFFLDAESVRLGRDAELSLYKALESMVSNPNSELYSGRITCTLDPNYVSIVVGDTSEVTDILDKVYSPDPRVLDILKHYGQIALDEETVDLSRFQILLLWNVQARPALVPNPRVLRRRDCVLWPHDVKNALGLTSTIQDLWLEPVALVPRGLPPQLSQPIYFEPSARHQGLPIIDAQHLKAGLTYQVEFEDRRGEVMNQLTQEQYESIMQAFEAYDADGSGSISKDECVDLVRERTQERKEAIDNQFEEFIATEPGPDAIHDAEEMRRMHYQQLQEAQTKMISMFENADVDGNGELSQDEFVLAEAWWLKCTLNPNDVSLF